MVKRKIGDIVVQCENGGVWLMDHLNPDWARELIGICIAAPTDNCFAEGDDCPFDRFYPEEGTELLDTKDVDVARALARLCPEALVNGGNENG